jgi:hypothetical protein
MFWIPGKSVRPFKGIIYGDISEFESYMASYAVRSPLANPPRVAIDSYMASAIILPRPGARRQNKLDRDGRRQSIFLLRDASLGVDSAHYGPLLTRDRRLLHPTRRPVVGVDDKLGRCCKQSHAGSRWSRQAAIAAGVAAYVVFLGDR